MTPIRPSSVSPPIASTPPVSSNEILFRIQTGGASSHTASQDGYAPGVEASRRMAERDMAYLKPYAGAFIEVGNKYGLPPALLAAIASRESRGGTLLDANGWGRGDPNGFGIMQVDRNAHTPQGGPYSREHIEQGARILKGMLDAVKADHPDWPPELQLRGAVAAYNMGPHNVRTREGIDGGTTGNDYSGDVMARAQRLAQAPEFGGRPSPPPGGSPPINTVGQAPIAVAPPAGSPGAPLDKVLAGEARLKLGHNGPSVRAVQDLLAGKGFLPQGDVDGSFGPKTQQAVSDFQKTQGLPVSGKVDAATLAALQRPAARPITDGFDAPVPKPPGNGTKFKDGLPPLPPAVGSPGGTLAPPTGGPGANTGLPNWVTSPFSGVGSPGGTLAPPTGGPGANTGLPNWVTSPFSGGGSPGGTLAPPTGGPGANTGTPHWLMSPFRA